LGIIPHNPEQNIVVVANNSNSPIAESFRSVRTNLTFLMRVDTLGPKASAKVIQVTSSVGSEGKSFCSVNLAASMAIGGSRTVIIGLDLRKPKLAQYFDISNDVGMSLVLSGHTDLNNAIVHSDIPGLDIIVGGPIPPNPSELLMSGKMAEVIKELEKAYDYIVLTHHR
jgi:capsular exopolysaccharide synthesis family protein